MYSNLFTLTIFIFLLKQHETLTFFFHNYNLYKFIMWFTKNSEPYQYSVFLNNSKNLFLTFAQRALFRIIDYLSSDATIVIFVKNYKMWLGLPFSFSLWKTKPIWPMVGKMLNLFSNRCLQQIFNKSTTY